MHMHMHMCMCMHMHMLCMYATTSSLEPAAAKTTASLTLCGDDAVAAALRTL